MSSPQDSETKGAAIEKALEGARLLSAGDYKGAIAACTEAIEFYPGSLGAYRTRAEAYKRWGREREAEADLSHVAYMQVHRSVVQRPGARDIDKICYELRLLGIDAEVSPGAGPSKPSWVEAP